MTHNSSELNVTEKDNKKTTKMNPLKSSRSGDSSGEDSHIKKGGAARLKF